MVIALGAAFYILHYFLMLARHKNNDIIKYLYSIDKKQRFSTYRSLAYIVYLLAFFE